jgi:hypothetical protein
MHNKLELLKSQESDHILLIRTKNGSMGDFSTKNLLRMSEKGRLYHNDG